MKKIGKILVIICAFFATQKVYAQTAVDTVKLYRELAGLQSIYKNRYISFNIKYRYCSELRPAVTLDSLSGKLSLYGPGYIYQLDNVETIANGTYGVVLFKNEKLMYVTKVPAVNPGDPLQQIRQVLQKAGVADYSITERNNLRHFHINFLPDGACREMDIVEDTRQKVISSVRYIVKTGLLTQSPQTAEGKTDPVYGPYAVVTTTFENYKPITGSSDALDIRKYFLKEGDELKPTSAFSDYQIFKGSPNL